MGETFCNGSFWDLNQTWNTEVPLFTSCFEDTVLVLGPCVTFSFTLLAYLCHLQKTSSSNPLPWLCLNITKLVLSVSLLVLSVSWCSFIGYETFDVGTPYYSAFISSCARVVTFVLVTITIVTQRAYGVTTSTTMSLFWIFFSISSMIMHRSEIVKYFYLGQHPESNAIFVISMIYHPIIYLQLILSVFADRRSFTSLDHGSPMEESSFISCICFLWFNKTIYKSLKKRLTVDDFSPLTVKLRASYLYKTLAKCWKFDSWTPLIRKKSLAWSLAKAFWPWMTIAFVLEFLYMLLSFLPPLILDRILNFVHDDHLTWRGYFYAAALFICKSVCPILYNNYIFLFLCSGAQAKSSLIESVFQKVLRISVSARKEYSSGSLMNLISVDVERIMRFMVYFSSLTIAPTKIILTIYVMWQYLGPSCLAGVGVIVILVPLSFYVSRVSEKYIEKQMEMKDNRLKYMNEILGGIKVLKLYAWEIAFTAKVSETRKKELKLLLYSQLCFVITGFVYSCAPFLIALSSFATYILSNTDNVLDPTKAFVSIGLMDQLRYALFEIPFALSELVQTNTALGRMIKFFITENSDPNVVGKNPDEGELLTLRNASLSWTNDSECVLKNIDLHVHEGDLIAVVGPVGSGKSSLLSAILGDLCKIDGSVDLKGRLAYVPQEAWILNRTLKDNILLVKNMNEEKYQNILKCCCLKPDLEVLPEGDETEIGEKGVNLSGGQKQRVSLARAIYQDKDIYLLDDPLSAVDVHVRKALIEDIIGSNGLLKHKTRILVTHDFTILPEVDLIVSLKEGKIEEIGSYHELLGRKGAFAAFADMHTNVDMSDNASRTVSQVISESATSEISCDKIRNEELEIVQQKNLDKPDRMKLIEDERMEIGGVKRGIYWNYIRHAGLLLFLPAILGYISLESFDVASNVWLSKWTADKTQNGTQSFSHVKWRLSIYGALGAGQALSTVAGIAFIVYASTKAGEKYHMEMLKGIMKCPMSFFDKTPMGRVMNRFGTDMDVIDTQFIFTLEGWISCLFSTLAAFVVIGMNTPIFLAVLFPLCLIYYAVQKLHLNASRQIKRLESTTRSPIYSHFMESVQGVSSIKAYNVQREFTEKLEEKLDCHILCYFNTTACNRWLNFWLNAVGGVIVLSATVLAIYNRHSLGASVVGLVITYALSATSALLWLVRMNTEVENRSVSIERIDEYCHLTPEAPWTQPENDPNSDWPERGQIVFDSYSTRYREDMDLVLKEISLLINPNEKVGVVGRTGAGKSSVTLALFRVIEPASGTILIDDVDISKIGLHALREKLTIIPQDPVLFTGTLRFNLDPNTEHDDEAIWASLEQSDLKTFVSNLSEGLEHNIEEGGSNLSAGQRQLVCLSRALLKNTKILVLDEATASVDMNTDRLIQTTIRTAFVDRTIITVAHRLKTVIDYDKIVVMEDGSIIEVGNPTNLMENTESVFYKMSKDAGLV